MITIISNPFRTVSLGNELERESEKRYDQPTAHIVSKSDPDIEALSKVFPLDGSVGRIEISLKTMLELCPRKRKRIESYRSLIETLGRIGIELVVYSQKTRAK